MSTGVSEEYIASTFMVEEYVGVLIIIWIFLFPIFLFAAQPK
jgi:hypothetical protein